MSARVTSAALGFFACCAACSSSGPGSSRPRGAASSSGNGGGASIGGAASTASGTTSTGETGSVTLPGGNGGGGAGGGCNDLEVTFEKVVPTVALLVDRSQSMFFDGSVSVREMLWDPLYFALMDPSGVVMPLENEVRFGFTAYNSIDPDPACPALTSVAPKLGNHADIDAAYTAAGMTPDNYYKWDTPTGESINLLVPELLADPDPGQKYILLVTDGNPDTCTRRDPQCGAGLSIDAVQKAYAAGIATFVVGIGDIVTGADDGCWGRCGVEHLQDLANAGTGQPVLRNTNQDFINTCTDKDNTGAPIYIGEYVDDPALSGSAPYYTASDPAALQTTLAELIAQVRSCSFEMNALVDLELANLGTVSIDGAPVSYEDPNGWRMANEYTVELVGGACEQIQGDSQGLFISFPCEIKTPRIR